MKKTFNLLAIGLILIALPVFAWYFLEKGTKMRKDAMADLSPKATMSPFQTSLEDADIFYSDSLLGKNWLIGVFSIDSFRNQDIETLKNIFKQTKEEFNVHVFTVIGLQQGELVREMGQKLQLPQDKLWLNSYMAMQHVFPFCESSFGIPEKFRNQNLIILLDRKGNIRNYYSLENKDAILNVVRQIPVFLSLKDSK